jgi:hypothetical protein
MTDNAPREHVTHTPTRADRAWAWAGALLAAGVSVAVNVAHAGPHTPSTFEVAELVAAGMPVPEQVGSWGFAAFAATLPVMVLIAAEQVARRLLGRATLPVMLGIGVCAYSLSFWHTVLLLGSWGEPWPLRVTGAVAVDGLAVASVIALWVANVRPDASIRTPDADVRPASGVRPEPVRTPDADVRPEPVRTPDASVRPEPVRTGEVNGREIFAPLTVRTPDAGLVRTVNGVRRPDGTTMLAERPASGRTAWTDAPTSGVSEAEVWAAWRAAGRPNDWPVLAALLGTNPEAARKRASRR